jgi:hypothetical protein
MRASHGMSRRESRTNVAVLPLLHHPSCFSFRYTSYRWNKRELTIIFAVTHAVILILLQRSDEKNLWQYLNINYECEEKSCASRTSKNFQSILNVATSAGIINRTFAVSIFQIQSIFEWASLCLINIWWDVQNSSQLIKCRKFHKRRLPLNRLQRYHLQHIYCMTNHVFAKAPPPCESTYFQENYNASRRKKARRGFPEE